MNENLKVIKQKLETALGPEDFDKYLKLIRKWFAQDLTKEQFDCHARKLIPFDKIHFHNELFVAILSKCNIQYGPPMHSSSSSSTNKKRGLSALKDIIKKSATSKSGEKRFRPSEPIHSLPAPKEIGNTQDVVSPESLQVCTKDGLLPDRSSMFGRALAIVWESGLDEIDETSVDLLVLATRDLLKNVMQSAIQLRRNFVLSEDNFPHLFGVDSSISLSSASTSGHSNGASNGLSGDACVSTCSKPTGPLSLRDVYDGLKVRPDVLPSQTVYSIIMERILCKLGTMKDA